MQVELYKRFCEEHLEVRISLRCFEGLKPYFVRKLRDRYTCCCIYHVQMIFLKEAMNTLRQRKLEFMVLHVIVGVHCACLMWLP